MNLVRTKSTERTDGAQRGAISEPAEPSLPTLLDLLTLPTTCRQGRAEEAARIVVEAVGRTLGLEFVFARVGAVEAAWCRAPELVEDAREAALALGTSLDLSTRIHVGPQSHPAMVLTGDHATDVLVAAAGAPFPRAQDPAILTAALRQLAAIVAEARRQGIDEVSRQAERSLVKTRLQILGDATTALGLTLAAGGSLDRVAALAVPALADWCAIDLVDEGAPVRRVGVALPDPSLRELAESWWKTFPANEDHHWIRELVRTRRSTGIVTIDPAMLDATGPGQAAVLRELGVRQVIVVPIGTRERAFGALTMVISSSERSFEPIDLEVSTELGIRIGLALENARLFKAEREARVRIAQLLDAELRAKQDLARLAHAGDVLSASIDYEQTLRSVVAVALPTLGDFGFFDILEGPDVRRVSSAHEDRDTLAVLDATRWGTYETGDRNVCALSHDGAVGFQPVIDEAWIAEGCPASLASLLRRLQVCSIISVPLRVAGTMIGALTLCFGKSGRHHSVEDLRLAEDLAHRAAVAVDHARLFRETQASVRRAEEAGRIKDEFLGTVSHELRTPLNAILGWSTMLLRSKDDPKVLERGLDVIFRNARAQARIVEDILEVSRVITGKLQIEPKSVDLVVVARQAMDVMRAAASAKRIALSLSTTDPSITLVADADRLLQVVWNLVSNALKFTPDDGSVVVSLKHDGPFVTIEVLDTGQGIDPAFLPHVFERFRQADSSTTREHGGLGLGLAIVRHIVELHGGTVAATSDGIGRGARFTVRLPVRAIAPSTEAFEPVEEPRTARELEGLKIIVVDDDPDAREIIGHTLEQAGADVVTCGSAEEGFGAVIRERPDVLVSDIGMPVEDGYALIARVRALTAEKSGQVPAIALSAYTRPQDQRRALKAGFTSHVAKPIEAPALVAAIASVVTAHRAG